MDARDRYRKAEIKKLAIRLNVLSRASSWASCNFVAFFENDPESQDKYSTHLFNFLMNDEEKVLLGQ